MIIQTICNLIFSVLSLVLYAFNIPNIDSEILISVDEYVGLIFDFASSLITLFIPNFAITIFIPIILVVELVYDAYILVMWVLKKIPIAGVQ